MCLSRGLYIILLAISWLAPGCLAQSAGDSTMTRTSRNQQTYQSISRSSEDSTKSVFNFGAAPWYARANPLLVYTGLGNIRDRISQSVEIGKSFNVIDLGVAVGRNSLRPDSTMFLEGRVTMDVANYGVFANEMTIGAGRVFDRAGSLMLELTYSIMAQVAPRLGIGLTTGYYDFSSEFTDSSKTFYGVYLRYGLLRTDSGGLLGNGRARPPRVGRPTRGHGRGHGH
ncbi:hypothetical protein [Fibrella forsythiae]|uniref:DUF5723 domain-containing protein n=1 Tax=Fibrella forsythiae TaxID=2817061 RepID=A0ABS3JPU7_9BACT|nr:hypothetical protein [Fibrella forsythiae]MBO0952024.1 hypothetical protein [Fibrella forsythiae]